MINRNPTQAISWLANIRARTWLILGAVGLALIGLFVWAGIALLSWLWTQAPSVTEEGKRLVGGAATRIEQVAPGLNEQAEQWLPAGVKEQAGKWLPVLGTDLPASDVSGTDIGPVPRSPGLVRSRYERLEHVIEVRYAGRAEFDAVLRHYTEGFVAAGFSQEVIAASREEERHRFVKAQASFELTLWRRPGGVVELSVKQIQQ